MTKLAILIHINVDLWEEGELHGMTAKAYACFGAR